MARLLVRTLVLLFCYGAVTSQGNGGAKLNRQAAPTQRSVLQSGLFFPNLSHTENADFSTIPRNNSNISVATNEVDSPRKYEVASDAVYNVATRLHHLLDPTGRKNYLVSPLSVALLAGQMLLAARGDSERRLRALLTSLRPTRADISTTSNMLSLDKQQVADLELHTQLGGLLKHLQGQGQTQASGYQLAAASAFFLNHDLKLKNSFQQAVSNLYASDLVRLNFSGDPNSALKALNNWASEHTFGRIPTIFPEPLSRFTAVVLVNSVYFRSEWENPFDPDLTTAGVFRLNGTHQIRVKHMRGQFEDLNFVDHPELACRMIVLPYKSADVNMYVVLPNREVTDMKDFAVKLTTSNITTLIKALSPYTVTVVLPKMTLKGTYSLKDPIMRYKPQPQSKDDKGPLPEVFSRVNRKNRTSTSTPTSSPSTKTTTRSTTTVTPPRTSPPTQKPGGYVQNRPAKPSGSRPNRPKNATNVNNNKPWFDLSGASTDDRFRVNDIIHQIWLEVSEIGTEAAAITSGSVDYSGDGKIFKVDRPFLFFIRHEPSSVNLFYSVVMDPTDGDYD